MKFSTRVPPPPACLDAAARAEYKRVVRQMSVVPGYLQSVDCAVLAGYAQSHSDYWRLVDEVRTEGEVVKLDNGCLQKNPKCALRAVAFRQMMTASAALGISPSSRVRVSAKGVRDPEPNPLYPYIGSP